MEVDEETKNAHEPSLREVEGSATEAKPLETVDITETEQFEFVLPESRDSSLLSAQSPVEANDEAAVGEEEEIESAAAGGGGVQAEAEGMSAPELDDSALAGAESPIATGDGGAAADFSPAGTAVGTEVEEDRVDCALDESLSELADPTTFGNKSPDTDKDIEAVVVEETPAAGSELEIRAETELVDVVLGKPEPELDDSQLEGANLPVVAEGGEAAVTEGEISTAGTELERKCETEVVEGGILRLVPLDESQPVGVEWPIVDEVVVEVENPRADSEMEMADEVEGIENGAGKFESVSGESHLVAESIIPAKGDDDEEAMAEEDTGMEYTDMETQTEVANEIGSTSVPQLDNSDNVGAESPTEAGDEDEEEEDMVAEDEASMPDTEMETETDMAEMAEAEAEKGVGGGGKRKRGRNSKVLTRAPSRKVTEEDVCFICFDGGELVLCDRRGCPKAYHPSCVNRDEAFFRAKGRWNCGWHLCSICEKNAHYMCYTCTFSLCKLCIKDAIILCVRGNKGFCETCMKTVMLIENNEQANKEQDRVDFDDKSSWEYLFKDYWTDLKAKLSLSSVELAQAKNPWKGSDPLASKRESPEELFDVDNDQVSGSESSENQEAVKPKRKKSKKRSKSLPKKEDLPSSTVTIGAEGSSIPGNTEWASKELLEFVMHMKNGDKSVLSQFDVQALLLEYIKRNKLRDPRRKSQIICDARFQNLFGKARVGHFEMLKLLESHFLIKEDSQTDDIQGSVVDTDVNQIEADGTVDASVKGTKDRRRRTRKKGYERGPQSNLNDYAAIDMHNISLIYLRRKLVEDLLEDIEKFHGKVVGTFVRIRISGNNQKQDMYRLVQVVGTSKAAEPYKVGKKTTDLVLDILNLSKPEMVSIDTISNQEFTEDECKRLRQSIKCGLIDRLTVGDILDKATELQAARVHDWLETEVVRLSHLRDRASEKGRRKELRECVEKLQLLKTPEERRRRLEEIPEIHADPNMDPSYESEDKDSETENHKQEIYRRPRGSGFSRRGREPISPRTGSFSPMGSWSDTPKSSKNWEVTRNIPNKDFLNKGEEATLVGEIPNESTWNQGRDRDAQQASKEKVNSHTNSETIGRNSQAFVRSESFSGSALETLPASFTAGVAETAIKISETEKMWHYQDPSGKVQGPFSIVQLRKWNNTGYFPVDLRIWRTTEKHDDSILLADALAGRFQKELPQMDDNITKAQTMDSRPLSFTQAGMPRGASLQGREVEGGEHLNSDQSHVVLSKLELSSSVEVSKSSDYSRNDSFNLPSPTPKSSTPRWTRGQASEGKLSSSSFPDQQAVSVLGVSSFAGGDGLTHSPAVATSDGGQFTHSATSPSINQSGNKDPTAMGTLGFSTPASGINSVKQVMRGSENDSLNSLAHSTQAPNSEQGIHVGPTTVLPSSQTIVTSESQGMHPPIENHGWGSGSVQKQEMVVPSHAVGTDSQAWGGASSQNLEPNPSLPVPVQPAAYGQWVGIPPAVHNPAGNFSGPGFSALPQPDPWRPPVAGNQPNMQPAAPHNVPWGMGITENNNFAPGPRPDNANTGWGPMQGNPNMGWGGPTPGTTNMSWGPTIPGPVPGTVNPGWVAPAGNPGPMVQGWPPGNVNPGWIAQTGNPPGNVNPGWIPQAGNLPGNANPGWAPQTGNPGSIIHGLPPPPLPPGNVNPGWGSNGNPGANPQGPAVGNVNPVWGAPSGNPGTNVRGPAPGNANPGWGTSPGNSGRKQWGNEKHRNGGDRFSGRRDRGSQGRDSGYRGGRPWNRQTSFGSGGQRVCPFHKNGNCQKGAACELMHT